MNNLYTDIRSRIPDPPVWFDENAVPRYCAFTPDEAANIYAKEVVLLRVTCQGCDREFDVCMSWGDMDWIRGVERLSKDVAERAIHYGDPPNVDCCPAGPTMNSVLQRVIEFWRAGSMASDAPRWVRVPELEIEVTPEWAADR